MALLLALGVLARVEPAQAANAPAVAFVPVARTAHVSYFAAAGQKVDIRRSEAFLDRLASLFGPAPEGWRLEYYRHSSTAALRERVGFDAFGVTDLAAVRVDSVRDFHPHELVHAVSGRLGRVPVFFAEGLAVALTSEGSWRGRGIDDIAREEMARHRSLEPFLTAFAEQDPVAAYAVAGSFSAFLLDAYGIEPMVAFLRDCGSSPERYEPAFRRAYGRTVASSTLEWQRALREQTASRGREWYDADTWPRSLRHAAPAGEARVEVAAAGAAIGGATTIAGGVLLQREP